jgi:NADP-reducing hydrogenase subunit HndB
MNRIKNREELEKIHRELKADAGRHNEEKVMIRVAMATCSIASGSKEVLDFLTEEMPKQPVGYTIKSTGCMGLCHSEPTVEVTMPGKEPVVFGKVDVKRAKTIVEDYIKAGKTPEGVIEGI